MLTFSEGAGGMATRLTPTPEVDQWEYHSIMEAARADFDRCPICDAPGPLTDEHVPPAPLGGSVLVQTCSRCNNTYGSFEDALLKRAESRFTMGVRGPGFRGERSIPDVILRRSADGDLVLTTWNGFWPDWADPLFREQGHEFQLERRCDCLAYAAMVKNGFLAACALNPGIVTDPQAWPVAQLLRRQLVAWRDTPNGAHLEVAEGLLRLHVRYDAPQQDVPRVELCEARHRETRQQIHVLRLGYQLVIAWPIDAAQVVRLPADLPASETDCD